MTTRLLTRDVAKTLALWVLFGAIFYGGDANLLYLMSGKSLYTIRMAKDGYHLKNQSRS